jgi:hypothetical protein
MMQRLMLGADFSQSKARRHWLDALPSPRQQQASTICRKRLSPVGMADCSP